MKFAICPLELIEVESEDVDERFVYGHLKHFLSKSQAFPAIYVLVTEGKAILDKGLIYLNIAKELGIETITIVVRDSNNLDWNEFCNLAGVIPITPKEVYDRDSKIEWIPHIIYFFEKVDGECVEQLRLEVISILGTKNVIDWFCADESKLLEFKSRPLAESQISQLLKIFDSFSSKVCQIESYQGRRYTSL